MILRQYVIFHVLLSTRDLAFAAVDEIYCCLLSPAAVSDDAARNGRRVLME